MGRYRRCPKGSLIVIAEQFTGRAPGPAVGTIQRLLDLDYHLALGGWSYRFADASAWLTGAGFHPPKRINLRSAPGTSLAVARRFAEPLVDDRSRWKRHR